MADYDALLLLSFGGPEGPDDVLPFLENVTRGRGVPRERLEEVAEQYHLFGGRSPINDQCRALLDALRAELERRGIDLPVVWGNRNWQPFVADTVAQLAADGAERVLALTTSAYSSYSACRQYREDLATATAGVGPGAPSIDKIRPYFNHPGFVDATAERVAAAWAEADGTGARRLVFTAHSIPQSMAETSDYEAQLREVARLVAERLDGSPTWDLVFQSRSGPPHVPWLEPDIVDHLRRIADDTGDDAGGDTDAAARTVVVAPIGFTSDHMEVLFDLDTQAAEAARDVGLRLVRAGTVGTHPAFVSGLVDLVEEHLHGGTPVAVGALPPRPEPCVEGCCPAPVRVRPARQ